MSRIALAAVYYGLCTLLSALAFASAAEAQEKTVGDIAQFQTPPASSGEGAPTMKPWTYGLEFDARNFYYRHYNLNNSFKDTTGLSEPELTGEVIYRPNDRFEAVYRAILGREVVWKETRFVPQPDGSPRDLQSKRTSLDTDEANVYFKKILGLFGAQIGRRNYEDNRHWLYDLSLDSTLVSFDYEKFRGEYSKSRERLWNLDPLRRHPRKRINNDIFYFEYRGVEDQKLAAYGIYRDDVNNFDGRPIFLGLRSLGMLFEGDIRYWTELAHVTGRDESSRKLNGYAYDAGATYIFNGHSLKPNITLGYAFGTGDRQKDSATNREFRQTGLQSNETMFAGFRDFKVYGEVFDPELSNLGIFTAGVGIRPSRNYSIELVFHHYRLQTHNAGLRNSPLEAEINPDPSSLSRDLGREIDLIVGSRHIFGIRGLGVDFRTGYFFPGRAYRIRVPINEDAEYFKNADPAFIAIVRLNYKY